MSATLNEKDLAERWKLTTRTLQLWRSKGIGPRFVRLGERSIFYRLPDIEDYEKSKTVGIPTPPEGWDRTVKRASAVIDMLAKKAATPKAKATLETMRDELRNLID